ncbi:MAG: hypothetical protein HY843_01755, partial [Bdellovibrio sp.]|nr:hypothetical protein [Bdellovibrio sp.]
YYPYNFWWLGFIYVFTAIFFAFSVRALTEMQYQNALVVKLLSHPLLVFIGILSYEIYLVHLMILPPLARTGLNKHVFIYSVLSVSLSIFSAWCLHRFFSVPMQRLIKKATTAQLIR